MLTIILLAQHGLAVRAASVVGVSVDVPLLPQQGFGVFGELAKSLVIHGRLLVIIE